MASTGNTFKVALIPNTILSNQLCHIKSHLQQNGSRRTHHQSADQSAHYCNPERNNVGLTAIKLCTDIYLPRRNYGVDFDYLTFHCGISFVNLSNYWMDCHQIL